MLVYHLLGHALLCAIIAARPSQYQRQGHSLCPTKILLKAPGVITSPRYQDHYITNTKCTWIIVAPKNALVSLQFVSLDVKSDPSCDDPRRCQCDYVQIEEVKRRSKQNHARKYCKDHYPKGIISTNSNKVRVHFKTKDIRKTKYFVLKYWFENKPRNSSPQNVNHSGSRKHFVDVKHERVTSQEQLSEESEVRLSLENGGKRGKSASKKRFIRAAPRANNSGVVVSYHEDKEKAKKEEEEADPPDAIVLGPAIPIILIFLGVVGSIAWWQFRSDQKERLRYYKEQIRYEEISNRSKNRFKKKKQNMREMRMKKLYGDMARNWQGTQSYGGPTQSGSRETKRSFAGRLLELAEKPVSYIRTPRSSRPSSMVVQEQGEPLVVMREKKDPAGRQPPSRPASVLLRDALNMIFGATAASQDAASDTPREPKSENDSNRASLKRVSFHDTVIEKMADVKEQEETATAEAAKTAEKPDDTKPAPLLIPHIMVRQPSYEGGGSDLEDNKKSPVRERVASDEIVPVPEQSSVQDSAPSTEQQTMSDDQDQDAQRPRSFEKKLVEMLESLRSETDEFQEDDADTDIEQSFAGDDLAVRSPPPVPNQTPVPRDSGSSIDPSGKSNCADLEDFLLNLDKELEADEDEP